MAVLGVDGWRGAWAGALLDGRGVRLLALPDVAAVLDVEEALADAPVGVPVVDALNACAAAWSARRPAECLGDGATDSRGRPMRICW